MSVQESRVEAFVVCPSGVNVYGIANPTEQELERLNDLRDKLIGFCEGHCADTKVTNLLGQVGLLGGGRGCALRFKGSKGMKEIRNQLPGTEDIETAFSGTPRNSS